MKKILMASAFALPVIAQAQSGVTIYGITDAGVRHTSGLSAANAPASGSATALLSGIDNTSRLGFRGVEDLGGGMRATFNFETGLNLDTGATANSAKFFDRASWVGIGGGWGTFAFGRQTNLLADAISPVDAVGMRFASFNPNIVSTALSSHGLGIEYGTTGANTGAYRLDNSVKYSITAGSLTGRAMYSLGEVSGNSSAQTSMGLGGVYSQSGWVVSGAYQKFKAASDLELDGSTLGVAYQWGTVKLAANWGRSKGETSLTAQTVQEVFSTGATWSVTPLIDVTAAYYRLDRERSGNANRDGYGRVILFTEYKLSRRTKLYAEADRTNWRGGYQGAVNKDHGTGISAGILHTF
ncbi:outer membrane protein (porin) [Acidovorax sp. CF316]|uniref:porin n=1 Tax=Acidovorax sp. CF316 TaxID=1144317 RepID=UPI00026BE7E0|nr:porin [Acidovorax sp. CF316]EJE50531.1 outer membrane protein (porin) [Acidovorax sp. CF316]